MQFPRSVTGLKILAAALGLGLLPGLAAAQACPDYTATPNTVLDLSAAQLAQPHVIPMVAGGNVDLGNCGNLPGYGHVVTGPDYHLTLSGTQPGTSLAVRVEAQCDTILLANDFTGQWYYDDDSGATWFDPELILPAADGVYDFWVGTWDTELCEATFSLQVASSAALNPCPDPSLPPAQTLSFNAGDLAQQQRIDVVAGGDLRLDRCSHIGGYGKVVNYPDFAINLSALAGMTLDIGLEGQDGCDTVLVVNDPAGNWHYNDDESSGSYGLSSRIRLQGAQDGLYHVWTGTWSDDLCYATLTLSAQQGLTKPGMGGSAQEAGALPDPGTLGAYRNQVGSVLRFTVTGDAAGSVWGSGPYTDDSALAAAAVHAGVLGLGQTGIVSVQITGPQASFAGSDRNGVSSRNYGGWDGSYVIVP